MNVKITANSKFSLFRVDAIYSIKTFIGDIDVSMQTSHIAHDLQTKENRLSLVKQGQFSWL